MKTEIRTITPKTASEMLKGNTRNRHVSDNHVNRLAAAILAGEWKLNGDAIRMNGGKLIDGQHRLHAVIKSGKPIRTLVVSGLDDDVFDTIDIGRKRTGANTLEVFGEKNAALLAGALRIIKLILAGKAPHNTSITNVEMAQVLAEHPDARESCTRISGLHMVRQMLRPSVAVALHYLFKCRDAEMADLFFSALNEGANLMPTDPVHVLRQRLIGTRSGNLRLNLNSQAAFTIKAWNACIRGEKIRCLKWVDKEAFPEIQ